MYQQLPSTILKASSNEGSVIITGFPSPINSHALRHMLKVESHSAGPQDPPSQVDEGA